MLTSNLWQEVGLCNGASGVVKDFIFHPDRPPPCLPIAALVKFPKYKGPAFLEDNPQTVPIPPCHTYLNGKAKDSGYPDNNCHVDYVMQ